MDPNAIIPVLTGIVILVTLRGQRIQNANVFRDIHREARGRARLVQLSFHRNNNGFVEISRDQDSPAAHAHAQLENHSPDAVSDVSVVAIWVAQENGDSVTVLVYAAPVLLSSRSCNFWTIPMPDVQVTGKPVDVTARWTDAAGLRWSGARSVRGHQVQSNIDPPLRTDIVSGISGRGPRNPTPFNHVRNLILPYDYWIPAIEPTDGLNPYPTRMQRFLILRTGAGKRSDRIARWLLKTPVARLGGRAP